MAAPRLPANLALLLLVLLFAIVLIQVGLVRVAFERLGLSGSSAALLLMSSLAGSVINLPLFTLSSTPPAQPLPPPPRLWFLRLPEYHGKTLIALNVGGALIPLCFSIYLLANNPLPLGDALLGVGFVALVGRLFSRPISGLGIGIPILIAPLAAALAALLINPEQRAPLAYISGTLGVLIGADLLRLKDIRRLGVPLAAIGGAGTFDGVFITGIVAVLLT
ncbi:MAG TPA: DUF1614 domain-containing protein [Gammaproteobacteria bacterium]